MTTRLFETLGFVADALNELQKFWALIGGLATSTYVEPRFTRDIDIAISVQDDRDAEDFLNDWMARGFVLNTVIEHDVSDRLATVRTHRSKTASDIVVDLLFASSGIEPEIAAQARQIEILPDLKVPVARPAHLFALKLLSVDLDTRRQDAIDLDSLAPLIVGDEYDAAREAIQQITARNYNRGRDLDALLDEYKR